MPSGSCSVRPLYSDVAGEHLMRGNTTTTTTAVDVQRQTLLGEFAARQAEELAFPASQWEADTLAAVLELPRLKVTRASEEKLLADGMARNACHPNCAALEERYPHDIRHVTGWLISDYMLVLHSVVETRGRWICVTPQTTPSPPSFWFIPDPSIQWTYTPSEIVPLRVDVRVPNALRKYPEDHILMRDRFRELIATGMTAFDARAVVDATLGDELRNKAPISAELPTSNSPPRA